MPRGGPFASRATASRRWRSPDGWPLLAESVLIHGFPEVVSRGV